MAIRQATSVYPYNVESNLEAASAPIQVDRPLSPNASRPRERDIRQEQIDMLVELGEDPEVAARVVDDQIRLNGPMDPAYFDSTNNPEKREELRQSIARGKASAARMSAFENEYNAATGHPEYGYDESGNAARLGRVDINTPSAKELRDAGARRYHYRAPYNSEVEAANYGPGSDYVTPDPKRPAGMTVPGPRTLDGKPVRPPQPLMTEEDVLRYETRAPGQLSQADKDMMARGMVPVVTPDGVAYQPGYVANNNKYAIPGGPGRPGPRTGLEKPYLDGKYELSVAVGPDGVPRSVYAPTAKFKAEQEEVARSRRRDASERKRKAREMWQATAMLAGGSHNINSGNRAMYNQLAMLDEDERQRALLYMSPAGRLAAGVDAQNMENANDVIKKFMTSGAAAGLNNPATAAALQQQQLQQRQEIIAWAEKNINDNYAYDADSWFGTPFTEEERGRAIDDLMTRYGEPDGPLTLAEATRIVDNIGDRKRKPATGPADPRTGPGGLPMAPTATPWRTGA